MKSCNAWGENDFDSVPEPAYLKFKFASSGSNSSYLETDFIKRDEESFYWTLLFPILYGFELETL